MGFAEFLAIVALTMSLVAMSIDIMLPALHDIGTDFGVMDKNDIQETITVFLLGFAIGQLLYGPLSDHHGRKSWLLIGLGIFCAASLWTVSAESFPMLLMGRFLQGFGAAAARIIPLAAVRDRYSGAPMARVMSFAMMVFIVIPILAPAIGEGFLMLGSWRWIFLFLLGFALLLTVWIALRLPETLHPEHKRALGLGTMLDAYRITLRTRQTLGYTIAMALIYSCLMAYIANAPQIFKDIYQLGGKFPLVFGAIAAILMPAAYSNAHLVGRLGLRKSSHFALLMFLAGSMVLALLSITGQLGVVAFCALMGSTLFFFAWTFPNFNAIAMEPLGEVAGTASSFIGFFTTAVSALLAWLIGQAFDGTVAPLGLSFAVLSAAAVFTVWVTEHGRLFGIRPALDS